MGNSSSQAVHLRTPSGPLAQNRGSRNRKLNKYVCAENRVLPAPVAGQRLRSTDNGNILQNGGTISGRKLAMLQAQQQQNNCAISESDITAALKRSGADDGGRDTLYGHRKSHSDPDIVRSMQRTSLIDEDSSEGGGGCGSSSSGMGPQLRSIIAESPSKAKIRWRKKGRAPDPPSLSNTLPRVLDRMPLYDENAGKARPRSKSPAPLPPPLAPPPPPGDMPPGGYEKNKRWRPQDNNFLSRSELMRKSFGEVESGNHQKNPAIEIQNKSFNAKLDSKSPSKPLNRSFQEEILAAARRKSRNLKEHVLSFTREEVYKSPPLKGSEVINRNIPAWEKSVATKEVVTRVQSNGKGIPASGKGRKPSAEKNNNFELRRVEETRTSKYNEEFTMKNRIQSQSNVVENRGSHVNGELHRDPKRYFFNNGVRQDVRKELSVTKTPVVQELSRNKRPVVQELGKHKSPLVTYQEQKQRQNDLNQPHEMRQRSEDEDEEWPLYKSRVENFKETSSRELAYREQKVEPPGEVSRQQSRDSPAREPIQESSRRGHVERWKGDNNSPRVSSHSSRYSSSSSSSDRDDDEDEKAIGVHLRPVLPRKAISMPQFSPTQAWKNLIVDSPSYYSSDASGSSSEDPDAVEEEIIMNVHRPVAPRRSFPERCADSGISPDAGSPLPVHEILSRRRPGVGRAATPPEQEAHWTPQQDLLDDSDMGSVQDLPGRRWVEPPVINLHPKLTLPNGMFMNKQIEAAIPPEKNAEKKSRNKRKTNKQKNSDSNQQFNSLRSLKKVLRLRSKSMEDANRGLDSNWSLSRSTPAIAGSEAVPKAYQELKRSPSESALNQEPEDDTFESSKAVAENGHLLYLPEYDSSPQLGQESFHITKNKKKMNKKTSKFSYQNTFRREAKKKLEEKVSREVMEKEKRREEEIKWMNKVEEEFRKRRDREKIDIRYQLKMLSDEETGFDSSGDWQTQEATQQSRSLPYVPSSKLNHSADNIIHAYTASSTSNSSPDLHPIWNNNKQATGMSKWLKKQPSSSQRPTYSRPEPEGGRSSGDEYRQHENINLISEDRNNMKNSEQFRQNRVENGKITYTEDMDQLKDNANKHCDRKKFVEDVRSRNDARNNKSKIKCNGEKAYKPNDDITIKDSSNFTQNNRRYSSDHRHQSSHVVHEVVSKKKPNIYKHLSSVVEREEKYQHHPDREEKYPHNPVVERDEKYLHHPEVEPQTKSPQIVPNQLPFSSEGFQTELMAKTQRKTPSPSSSQPDHFSRAHPHRSGGRMPRPLTSSQAVTTSNGIREPNRSGGKSPVLHLSPVTPFSPGKGYRPVPFDLVVAPAKHRSNNTSSPMCADSRPVRTPVEAR